MKRKMINGLEYDAYTGWNRYIKWKPGERRNIKRGTHKRERREGRRDASWDGGE